MAEQRGQATTSLAGASEAPKPAVAASSASDSDFSDPPPPPPPPADEHDDGDEHAHEQLLSDEEERRCWKVALNGMPAPSARLLYDDNGFGVPMPDLGRWNSAQSLHNDRPAPGAANRKPKKRHVYRSLVYCVLVLLMLVFGIIVGAFLFHNFLGGRCSGDNMNGTSPVQKPSLEEEINTVCGFVYPWRSIRIPTSVIPTHYTLFMHPNLTRLDYVGKVDILMRVLNSTSLIVLNQADLNLISVSLYLGKQKLNVRHAVCNRLNQWAFMPEKKLIAGQELKLTINFSGRISKNFMAGFYVNHHIDHQTKTETISAVTQFEPTHARRAFPCFDEPSFKAIFNLSIVRERNHVARANTHLIRTEEYNHDLEIDYFAPTLTMSTYILAFAVLNGFNKQSWTTSTSKSPIEVNLFANVPDIQEQAEFGLNTTVRALGYFETYFDIPFPLKKTDLLALDDFAEGAMENWGLITFRDAILLYDKEKYTEKVKENTALVVCHEIAHQWFGNYVTMKWWNDLWLNEGFANFMEFLCVDQLYPQWDIMSNFFLDNHVYSLMMDGFHTSHPVSVDVDDPAQISSIFDAISYSKGSSILKMAMALSGQDNFQRALQEYLKEFAYRNAEGEDLWRVLEKHTTLNANMTMTRWAHAWTQQTGYPMVQVSLSEDGTKMMLLNQTRFLYLEEARHANVTEKWPIPMMYRSSAVPVPRLTWLQDRPALIDLGNVRSKWLVANADAHGYYRVLYSRAIYREFARQLARDHLEMTTVDRASIINDAFAFLKSGHLKVGLVMELISYVEEGGEEDRIPWLIILHNLRYIEYLVADEPELLAEFERFQRHLILRTYEAVGWERQSRHARRQLQPELLHAACRLDIANCTKEAVARFYLWLSERQASGAAPGAPALSPSVPVDLQPLVLDEGVRHGTRDDWTTLADQYVASRHPYEKNGILVALTSSTDQKVIHRFLKLCLDEKFVRPNVLPRLIGAFMQNRDASATVWQFLRQHQSRIENLLGDTTLMFGTLLKVVIENFSTEFDLREVERTFGAIDMGASRVRFEQALESIKLNIQWRRLNQQDLKAWLQRWSARHKH